MRLGTSCLVHARVLHFHRVSLCPRIYTACAHTVKYCPEITALVQRPRVPRSSQRKAPSYGDTMMLGVWGGGGGGENGGSAPLSSSVEQNPRAVHSCLPTHPPQWTMSIGVSFHSLILGATSPHGPRGPSHGASRAGFSLHTAGSALCTNGVNPRLRSSSNPPRYGSDLSGHITPSPTTADRSERAQPGRRGPCRLRRPPTVASVSLTGSSPG